MGGSRISTCRRRGWRPGSLPFLTGSFTDYNIPRADQVPDIDVTFNEVLEPTDDRGVKGICEGGACGAPPAVVHAVLNARGVWRRGPGDAAHRGESVAGRAIHRSAPALTGRENR